jgi:hypothetical protein
MKKYNDLFPSKNKIEEAKNPLVRAPIEIQALFHANDYKLALRSLIDAVEQDKDRKHTLYFWAAKVARQTNGVDFKKLASAYLKWLKKTNPKEFIKLTESLSSEDSLSIWIKDFQKSDAPQFKGKSKEERKKMAIAAYLSSRRHVIDENDIPDELIENLYEEETILSEEESELIENIWADVVSQMFDENILSIDSLVEDTVSRFENLLFEETQGLPNGAQIVFGKVIKDGNQIGIVKDKKFVAIKDRDEKNVDQSKATVKNVFRRIKHEVRSIAADLGESKKSVSEAFAQKDVQSALSKVGYSVKKAGSAVHRTVGIINTGLAQSFQEIEKAGGLEKLKKGTQKIDDFLDRNPIVKKMAGPLVAGALIYQWNNMSFTGDFNDDFDVTSMINAATGSYSISDLASSSNGAKAITQLAVGLATGKILSSAISFPWKLGIGAALAYTGAKKIGKSDLAKKAMDKIKELNSKTKTEEFIYESSSSNEKIIRDLLSDPANVKIIDAINDGKKSIVVDFINKNIKNKKIAKQILSSLFESVWKESFIHEEVCDVIPNSTLKQIENFADMLLKKHDIDIRFTQHFGERMSDSRNSPCISIDELKTVFKKINKDEGEKIKAVKNAEAVIKDLQSQLNLPVVINYSAKNGFEVVLKTIMRKKSFKTPDRVISV